MRAPNIIFIYICVGVSTHLEEQDKCVFFLTYRARFPGQNAKLLRGRADGRFAHQFLFSFFFVGNLPRKLVQYGFYCPSRIVTCRARSVFPTVSTRNRSDEPATTLYAAKVRNNEGMNGNKRFY